MKNYSQNHASKGFTLIELVAVTAMLGVLAGMLLPSIDSANKKARNAKLKNDLVTMDSAIQLYKMEQGKCPDELSDLTDDYIAKGKTFNDAVNEPFKYSAGTDTLTYTLSGKNAEGTVVLSDGSQSQQ